MHSRQQFMVDFSLPNELCEEFFDLIPYQRAVINKYFCEGKLLNYSLSIENAKLWAIFNAGSEMEVMEMIVDFPLTKFMTVQISTLALCELPTGTPPEFSLN